MSYIRTIISSLWSWFEVFNMTPAGELIEANCHARLNCLKHLLNDVVFIQFNNTRKPSCRWQTRATLAKSLHGLRKSSGVVSCRGYDKKIWCIFMPHSVVTPVYLRNNKSSTFSVTPILSRLAEKLVVQKWLRPLVPPVLISDQYAFKPTGSTTAALVHFTHYASTRKPSCRWQTRATLAKSLHGLRKSSGVVSCIARLPIDSMPIVSYYVLYSNCVCKMRRFGDTRLLRLPWPWNPGQGSLKVIESDIIR